MNDRSVMRRRLLKYLAPVFLLSILINVTKFFEAKLIYEEKIIQAGGNVTARGKTAALDTELFWGRS